MDKNECQGENAGFENKLFFLSGGIVHLPEKPGSVE
jgi:hypothetical protein